MRTMNGLSIAAMVLMLSACQRSPADVTAVAYQVLDAQAGEGCAVCLVPARTACGDGAEAGELRWNLPAGLDATGVRIQLLRTDGERTDLAAGSTAGAASFTEVLHAGDRIEVLDETTSQQLMYIQPAVDSVCPPKG